MAEEQSRAYHIPANIFDGPSAFWIPASWLPACPLPPAHPPRAAPQIHTAQMIPIPAFLISDLLFSHRCRRMGHIQIPDRRDTAQA